LETTYTQFDRYKGVRELEVFSSSPDKGTDILTKKSIQTHSRWRPLKLCQPLAPKKAVEHFLVPKNHQFQATTRRRVSFA
jgi:hypothetical protein